MKKLVFLLLFVIAFNSILFAEEYKDIPFSHWAYSAVKKVSESGILQGYPNNTFQGGKKVNRYVLAMTVAKILQRIEEMKQNGQSLDAPQMRQIEKLTVEFADELALLGIKLTALGEDSKTFKADVEKLKEELKLKDAEIRKKRQRLLMSGRFKYRNLNTVRDEDTDSTNDNATISRIELNWNAEINEQVFFYAHSYFEPNLTNDGTRNYYNNNMLFESAYIELKLEDKTKTRKPVLKLGKIPFCLGHGILAKNGILNGLSYTQNLDRDHLFSLYVNDNSGVSGVTDGTLFTLGIPSQKIGFYYYKQKMPATTAAPSYIGFNYSYDLKKNMKLKLELINYDGDSANADDKGNVYYLDLVHKLNKKVKLGLMYAAAGEYVQFRNNTFVDEEDELSPFENAGLDGYDVVNDMANNMNNKVSNTSLAGYSDIQFRINYKLAKKWDVDFKYDMVSANDSDTGAGNRIYDIYNVNLASEEATPFNVMSLCFTNKFAKDTNIYFKYYMISVGDNDSTAGIDESDLANVKQTAESTIVKLGFDTKF